MDALFNYFHSLTDQDILNHINIVLIASMAIRMALHEYKLTRDSVVGTIFIILCVCKIWELLPPYRSTAGISSIASNLFLCLLVYKHKGNIVNIFRKVDDE
ncbi:hypothetical protein J6836_00625 [Providencia sp. R33]|uniref:hypothetical protein n=1 Tax=Providencia sp. R33 TaxID=2828763 RepID=UPI001C5AA24F|nr:hypothetical protein J6836_00625 [Providencia sp. R33]